MTAAPDMKPSEALRKAREVITLRQCWIKGEIALDDLGNDLAFGGEEFAVCWCSMGAIEAAIQYKGPGTSGINDLRLDALERLENLVGDAVDDWNDDPERTHAEVLDAFDRAAALAEAEGC